MRLSNKMGSTKYSLDFMRGLYLWPIILSSHPSIVDVVLQVPMVDEFLYLILQGDALLGGMTDISVESVVLILISLEAISS